MGLQIYFVCILFLNPTMCMSNKKSLSLHFQELKMIEQALLLKLSAQNLSESNASQLRQEYLAYQRLFNAQSSSEQQYLNAQAVALSDAIIKGKSPMHFSLPDQIVCLPLIDCNGVVEKIPEQARQHRVGSLLDRLTHANLSFTLSGYLSELEKSTNQAVSAAAGLIRFAVTTHMIYHLVPEGKTTVYATIEDDDIPNQPINDEIVSGAGIKLPTDLKFNDNGLMDKKLSAPQESYRRGFFLPQLVALDDQNRLLEADLDQAISHINTMRNYLFVLNSAVGLAPYMVVDESYQYKRYGILGQLVNQGRALASYQVDMICNTIKQRAASHRLDRGFSLSLPYFNDQTLAIDHYTFDVIPKGRVMFVPAFVVIAVRAEGLRVMQNVHLNHSTRRHLLQELIILEKAFIR
jgi:hypothetical protein